MRIVWLSANRFGYELLSHAKTFSHHGIVAVVTLSPDAKTHMYDGVDPRLWEHVHIPLYTIHSINEEQSLLRSLLPDIVLVCGWRQMISSEIFSIPTQGTIGFHPTLLPCGRGPAPIINTILSGMTESGVTMFYLSEGVDAGDIIGQKRFSLSMDDDAGDVYNYVIQAGKSLLETYLPLLHEGTAPRIPQDETRATLFPKRSLEDNRIDMVNDSIDMIERKIRAFSLPYRGAYLEKDGKKLIIQKAKFIDAT